MNTKVHGRSRGMSDRSPKAVWQKLFKSRSAPIQPVPLPKMVYVHIPKAGGSAVNDYFSRQLGPDNCAIHAEGVLRDPSADHSTVSQKQYISAHLTLPRLLEQIKQPDQFVLTVLRDPLDQTVSHLAWMRYQAEKSREAAFGELPEYVQQLVRKLADTDFADAGALGHMLRNLEPREISFFDNCQTRYLTRQAKEPVDKRQLRQAIQNLSKLDMVGIAEYMQDVFDCLSWHLGLPAANGERRVNVSRTKFGLDTGDPAMAEVLEPYIQFDRLLYAEAQCHCFAAIFRVWEQAENTRSGVINRRLMAKIISERASKPAKTADSGSR